MHTLQTLLLVMVVCVLVLPYIAVAALRIIFRQSGFRANVGGPKSLTRICFFYQLKLNLKVQVTIDSLRIQIQIPTSLKDFFNTQGPTQYVKICVQGLSINLLLKDDFETWGT
jgi:hypothetical protein